MEAPRKQKRVKLARRLQTWPPTRIVIELWLGALALFATLFGPRWAYFWARRVAWFAWTFLPRVRGVILRNVDLCLRELPLAERTRIGRESLKHNIYTFVDMLLVPRLMRGENWRKYVHLKGDCDAFFRWLGEKKSSFSMSAHFGNWELLLVVVAKHGMGYALVVRPPNLRLVARWLERYRKFANCELIEKKGALRALLQRVREKRPVALLADQNGGDFAPVMPFFGVPATWQTEFSRLVHRAEGRVALGWTVRHGDKFEFTFHAPEFRAFAEDAEPMEIMEWYRQWVERVVRANPEQYFWVHKRFKGRQEGMPDRYERLEKRLSAEERARLVG